MKSHGPSPLKKGLLWKNQRQRMLEFCLTQQKSLVMLQIYPYLNLRTSLLAKNSHCFHSLVTCLNTARRAMMTSELSQQSGWRHRKL